ncbi:nitrilase-related carbon-nitrogen hydrolase [Paeniglutamicibacter sp. NPDC012692]|uniref:nitrilase-related carbon-nitrogen hydrolase n=1 Tax=Paeniglutamicibacter sp. NPDC012692 TaxID=3364388 RepID=UPI0036974F66
MQSTGNTSSPKNNLSNVAYIANQARDLGADLLVTPELYSVGYAPEQVHQTDGKTHRDQLAAIAAISDIGLVASTVEHDEGKHYICASLFNRNGVEQTRYRKQHLFGTAENEVFSRGTEAPEVVLFDGIRIALGICFDVEFPEFVRAAAVSGAQLLCVPTAVPLRPPTVTGAHPLDTRLIPSMVVPTRALENQMFIAYANHSGPDFAGLSTIADPYGRRLATAWGMEDLITASINIDDMETARADTGYFPLPDPCAT